MQYPDSFIAKVTEVFPNHASLARWLRSGDETVGTVLEHSRHLDIPPAEIVTAIETGNTSDVLEKAKRFQKIEELYQEWEGIHEAQKTQAAAVYRK